MAKRLLDNFQYALYVHDLDDGYIMDIFKAALSDTLTELETETIELTTKDSE
tara:strand:+ start:2224 stop:2379 length:156 start_codon:yes stop_codon:yes gene_type:complete